MGRFPFPLMLAACLLWPGVTPSAEAASPAYRGDAQLLVDATDTVGAITAMVRQARRSILVDCYMLAGPRGEALAAELIRRHREGLAVRVLLDPKLGHFAEVQQSARRVIAAFNEAGVPVRYYPTAALSRLTGHTGARDHNKVVVADLDEAYVGSLNFGSDAMLSHDVGVWLTGNTAHAIGLDILAAFDQGEAVTAVMPKAWPAHDLPLPRGDAQIRFVSAGLESRELRSALLAQLADARHSIDVLLFMLADSAVESALIAAHQRGVKLRVLLDPNRFAAVAGPLAPPAIFNLEAASRLQAAGVPVRWYRPKPGELALHAKSALIDQSTLLVGTPNWTHESFESNHETLLTVSHGAATRAFKGVFDADWAGHSEPLQLMPSPWVDGQIWIYRGLTRLIP